MSAKKNNDNICFYQIESSSHETHYNYVDNTERDRREAEEKEKLKRLENEREQLKLEVLVEREKLKTEASQREKCEQHLRRLLAKEQSKNREGEQKRLQLEAKLCRLRDGFFNYQFGNITKLDNFLGLQIEDVTQLRIGVFGPSGSGKSCFINTCERTVRQTEKGTASVSTTAGQEETITLQDYLSEMFFRLVDTRGFFYYNANEAAEFEDILTGKIQPGDLIVRPEEGQARGAQGMHQRTEFRQRMHGIIFVVNANNPRLEEDLLRHNLEPFRDILRETGKVLIIFFTILSMTLLSVD